MVEKSEEPEKAQASELPTDTREKVWQLLGRAQQLSAQGDRQGSANAFGSLVDLLLNDTEDEFASMLEGASWAPDETLAVAPDFSESTLRLIGFLKRSLDHAVKSNESFELQLVILDGIIKAGKADSSHGAKDGWDDWFQLQRALTLMRLDREDEADEICETVTSGANATPMLALSAGWEHCLYLCRNERWAEAARAGTNLKKRWIHHDGLTLMNRRLLEKAMGVVPDAESADPTQTPGRVLKVLSDIQESIDWARQQPEREFQERNADRLWDMIRRSTRPEYALNPLEQLVALLVELDDETITKLASQRITSRIAWLLVLTADDQAAYDAAMLAAIDEQEFPPEPDDLGISDQSVSRLERLGDAFEQLGELLPRSDEDHEAAELRAKTLFAQIQVVTRLGQDEKATSLFDRMAAIGADAITACNSLIAEAEEREASVGVATLPVAGLMMVKAGLLMSGGYNDSALVVFTQVVDRFEHSNRPLEQSTVQAARSMQQELLDANEFP